MPNYSKDYYKKLQAGARASAAAIVPLIIGWISPRSVIDVGCGSGTWLSVFRAAGVSEILGVDCLDADEDLLEIPPQHLLPHDLTLPLRLDREFDLVVSLEVAEHLTPEHAAPFVRTLTRLGPVVLFSAAIPFQGGRSHFNEQWPFYWVQHFQERGYVVIDCIRDRVWNNTTVDWWYSQNSMIFVRDSSLSQYPLLRRELESRDRSALSLVHPRKYEELIAAWPDAT